MSREEVITDNGGWFNPESLPECPFRKHLELTISRIERLGREMDFHYRKLGLSAFNFEVVFTNSTAFHTEIKKAAAGRYIIVFPAGFYLRLFALGYLLFYLTRHNNKLQYFAREPYHLDISRIFSSYASVTDLYYAIDDLLPEVVKARVSKELIYALETSLYFEFFHHLGFIQKQQVEFKEKIVFSGNYKRINLSLEDLSHGLELNADLFAARMTISYLLDHQKQGRTARLNTRQVQYFLNRLSFAYVLRFLVNELHNNLGVSMRRYRLTNPFRRMLFTKDFGKIELQDNYSSKLADYWEQEFRSTYKSMLKATNVAFVSSNKQRSHGFPDTMELDNDHLEHLQNDTLQKLDMVNILLRKFNSGELKF